jgi:hypothetical protein
MDVSADLTELGRTPVAVVCAGAKSVLDIPRTLVGSSADARLDPTCPSPAATLQPSHSPVWLDPSIDHLEMTHLEHIARYRLITPRKKES